MNGIDLGFGLRRTTLEHERKRTFSSLLLGAIVLDGRTFRPLFTGSLGR